MANGKVDFRAENIHKTRSAEWKKKSLLKVKEEPKTNWEKLKVWVLENKILATVLAVFILVILVGGVIAIIVTIANYEAPVPQRTPEDYNSISIDDAKTELGNTAQESGAEAMVEQAQEYINATNDEKRKAEIYSERANQLFHSTEGREKYAGRILGDAIEEDRILQTADSAEKVMRYAKFLGNTEVEEQYRKMFEERYVVNTEGRG